MKTYDRYLAHRYSVMYISDESHEKLKEIAGEGTDSVTALTELARASVAAGKEKGWWKGFGVATGAIFTGFFVGSILKAFRR